MRKNNTSRIVSASA